MKSIHEVYCRATVCVYEHPTDADMIARTMKIHQTKQATQEKEIVTAFSMKRTDSKDRNHDTKSHQSSISDTSKFPQNTNTGIEYISYGYQH